jgi:hypothetical protein
LFETLNGIPRVDIGHEGEILIINHDGPGWWDPLSQARGDVFHLVQHLDPSLDFGHVRRVLRRMVGVAPSYQAAPRDEKGRGLHNGSPSAGTDGRACTAVPLAQPGDPGAAPG